VNGKFADITRGDVVAVAERYDVAADGRGIIEEVLGSLEGWSRYSVAAGVPEEFRTYLEGRFERLRS
jgi:hypothetical protein